MACKQLVVWTAALVLSASGSAALTAEITLPIARPRGRSTRSAWIGRTW